MRPLVVIDTNILLASISSSSPYRWILDKLIEGKFVMAVSNEVYLEYEEQIRIRFSETAANFFFELMKTSQFVLSKEPSFHWNLITADGDDNKFTDLAVVCNADFIVTHDKHFDILKQVSFPSVRVINIEEFKKIIEGLK